MKQKSKVITLVSFYIAAAVMFELLEDVIPIFRFPNGGNICIAIIPIFICSFQFGPKIGILSGFCWWLLTFILGFDHAIINFYQILLDQVIPALLVGGASIFPKIGKINRIYTDIIFSMFFRYLSMVISVALFWYPKGSGAGSLAAWLYSLVYNLSYNIPTLVVALLLTPLLIRKISKRLLVKFKYID